MAGQGAALSHLPVFVDFRKKTVNLSVFFGIALAKSALFLDNSHEYVQPPRPAGRLNEIDMTK